MRTRFPPSPTGLLHVGGLRTALYSYLVAKQAGGTFYLRIEDTDQAREVPGAIENILKTLHWAGIDPDEGVILRDGKVVEVGSKGPYVQSKRVKLYQDHTQKLLASGHAYRCFCTRERLDAMRKAQEAKHQPPMYDRTCRGLSIDESHRRAESIEPYVIRLKVPDGGETVCRDLIHGEVRFRNSAIDDQVLQKSDGFPTYHLAHVVDDHLMETTIVTRGEEWLSSLPKHLLLFRAFGWDAPQYAHFPLILNAQRAKLSKREADVAVEDYIRKGYLPEALLNFVALLGWNPGTTQEIVSLEEMMQCFTLERVQKAGAVFDVQKLDWLQGQWMRRMRAEGFASRIQPLVVEKFPQAGNDRDFPRKAKLLQDRVTFLSEAPDMLGYFYEEPTVSRDLLVNTKQGVTPDLLPKILQLLQQSLEVIPEEQWTEEKLKEVLTKAAERGGFRQGQVLWPLRAALTGRSYSPGAYEVAAVLGRERTLRRLSNVNL